MCVVTPAARLELRAEADAPRRAREFASAAACTDHHSRVDDRLRLLVSELVTNAVRYARPPIVLAVECREEVGLQVSVADAGPPVIAATSGRDGGRDGGRDEFGGHGLPLLAVVSDDWGVLALPDGSGKEVWFTLRAA